MAKQQTGTYLVYIDESYDTTHFAYSAMFINAFEWNFYFDYLLKWRREWFQQHNIPMDYELHATKLIGGRGEPRSNPSKIYRASLFHDAIGRIEKINGVKVINAITDNKKKCLQLFEYMLNRINRMLEDKNAIGILICDEGNENKLTSIVRKMKKENYVPSAFRKEGYEDRNIPLKYIIEDPLFKTSKSSYFIQLADFLAFSLLRNEKPLKNSTPELVKNAFDQLDSTLIKQAFKQDPRNKGIIRV